MHPGGQPDENDTSAEVLTEVELPPTVRMSPTAHQP